MNRRNFLGKLLAAGAAFSVLPSATTYARNWVKREALWIPNPDYVTAEYEIQWIGSIGPKPDNCVLPIIFQREIVTPQDAIENLAVWKQRFHVHV